MLKVQICENVGEAFVSVYGRADAAAAADDVDYRYSKHIKAIMKRETVLCLDVLLLSLLRFK
jgi:hypothetical protein